METRVELGISEKINEGQDVKKSNSIESEDKLNVNAVQNSEDKGNNKIRLSTHVSYFSQGKKNKNKDKHKTKCQKFKHYLYIMIENVYFTIIMLLLSFFSLFAHDIQVLSLPKSVDYPFYHLSEFIFIFFLVEFLILVIAKKKFIGSFYFYLDIVSLISLVPDVHFMWDPLIVLIAGSS